MIQRKLVFHKRFYTAFVLLSCLMVQVILAQVVSAQVISHDSKSSTDSDQQAIQQVPLGSLFDYCRRPKRLPLGPILDSPLTITFPESASYFEIEEEPSLPMSRQRIWNNELAAFEFLKSISTTTVAMDVRPIGSSYLISTWEGLFGPNTEANWEVVDDEHDSEWPSEEQSRLYWTGENFELRQYRKVYTFSRCRTNPSTEPGHTITLTPVVLRDCVLLIPDHGRLFSNYIELKFDQTLTTNPLDEQFASTFEPFHWVGTKVFQPTLLTPPKFASKVITKSISWKLTDAELQPDIKDGLQFYLVTEQEGFWDAVTEEAPQLRSKYDSWTPRQTKTPFIQFPASD